MGDALAVSVISIVSALVLGVIVDCVDGIDGRILQRYGLSAQFWR